MPSDIRNGSSNEKSELPLRIAVSPIGILLSDFEELGSDNFNQSRIAACKLMFTASGLEKLSVGVQGRTHICEMSAPTEETRPPEQNSKQQWNLGRGQYDILRLINHKSDCSTGSGKQEVSVSILGLTQCPEDFNLQLTRHAFEHPPFLCYRTFRG